MIRCLARVIVAGVAGLMLLGGSAGTRDRQVLVIRAADVTARADEDTMTGQYYTTILPLPANLEPSNLDRAILDLYVDVGAKSRDGFVNTGPILEVCAMKGSYPGEVRLEDLDLETRAVRPVPVGRGRHVKLDVTKIVRAGLGGASNHGLILGSLTGMREGDFTVVSGRFSGSTAAQIVVYRTMAKR